MWAVLGADRGLSWRSWAVLGRSWALCWRSWAALGAYVGGLGSGSGPKLAVLGGLGAEVVGLGSDQGEKWPKPERERDPEEVGPAEEAEAPRSTLPNFFYRYMCVCVGIGTSRCLPH